MPRAGIPPRHIDRRNFLRLSAAAGAAVACPPISFASGQKVTAAIGVDMWYINYIIAEEKGFWKKNGLEVSIAHFDNGAVALDALVTGNGDIGSATNMSMMQRVARGAKMYATSSMAASGKLYSIVSGKSLTKPQDLIGKKLGLAKDGILEFLYMQFATNNGIGLDQIELVNISPPEAVAALTRGDVDATMFWEPWPSKVLELVPDTHTLRQLSEDNIFVTNWLFMGVTLMADRGRAEATLRTLLESSEFIKANKDEVIEIGARRLKTEPQNARFQYENLEYTMEFPKERYEKDFMALADFNLSKGLLKSVPPMAEIARPEIMAAVAPELAPGW